MFAVLKLEQMHPLERAARDNPNEPIRWAIYADWIDENATDELDHFRAASLRHRALPDVFPHPYSEIPPCTPVMSGSTTSHSCSASP